MGLFDGLLFGLGALGVVCGVGAIAASIFEGYIIGSMSITSS